VQHRITGISVTQVGNGGPVVKDKLLSYRTASYHRVHAPKPKGVVPHQLTLCAQPNVCRSCDQLMLVEFFNGKECSMAFDK
jgi:hypothetical protein